MSTLAAVPASAWRAARRLNPFYSPITFSITAEDVAVVEQGLEVRPGDRVVCVGSAGDTALSLLAKGPSHLTAVDFSFAQFPLFDGVVTGEQWANLAVSGTLTLLLPLAVGLVLVRRSEVK